MNRISAIRGGLSGVYSKAKGAVSKNAGEFIRSDVVPRAILYPLILGSTMYLFLNANKVESAAKHELNEISESRFARTYDTFERLPKLALKGFDALSVNEAPAKAFLTKFRLH